MTRKLIISSDSHVQEPDDLFVRTLGNKYGDAIPRVVEERFGQKGRFLFTGEDTLRDFEPELLDFDPELLYDRETMALIAASVSDPAVRIQCMDMDHTYAEVLGTTFCLFLYSVANGDMVRDCFRVYNDWLDEYCSHDRKRLTGVGLIYMDDVEWAAAELERAAKMGMRCAMINSETRPDWAPYHDAKYDPFWARAEELAMPVQLHILTGNRKDPSTLGDEELDRVAWLHLDTANDIGLVLANEFIFGGIFDRFPDLQLVIGEYEISWLPYWLFRVEQMEKSFGPLFHLKMPKRRAREYLDQVHIGVIDDSYIAHVKDLVPPEHILWGSDFPHARNTFPNSHAVIERVFAHLDEAGRDAVSIHNAEKLFKIDMPVSH